MKANARAARAAAVLISLGPISAGSWAAAWSGRMESVAFGEWLRATPASAFARIADLPDVQGTVELRPEVTWESAPVTVALKPRAVATVGDAQRDWDLRVSEASIRFRPQPGLSLLAGREVLLWGPATFWNPSNPFFTENNRGNPQRELDGIDLARARWQISRAWSATAISQFDRGTSAGRVARRHGVKLDWVGDAASAACVAAASPGQRLGLHAWTQATVSDALLLYGEMGWSEGATSAWPERAAAPTGWLLELHSAGGRTLKVLAGGAYTLEIGITAAFEVWHSGDGWDAGRRAHVAEFLADLVRQPHGLADGQIAGLLAGSPEPYGRNRAGLQCMNAGDSRTAWLVRLTRDLEGRGEEWLAYLRQDLSDRWQVWGSVVRRGGDDRSGFGLGVRTAVSLGVTWRPW